MPRVYLRLFISFQAAAAAASLQNVSICIHSSDFLFSILQCLKPLKHTLQVSSLYMDPSIGNYVNVVVVKIILIDDDASEPLLNVSVNAGTTLKNFCNWQKNLNPGNDTHPHHHDVAILITRKDICARQDVPCNTLGVAHVGGMCHSDKSCSVNEDNGITLAHTIAHEMGHK